MAPGTPCGRRLRAECVVNVVIYTLHVSCRHYSPPMSAIRNTIRERRLQLQIGQSALAQRAGISRQALSAIESGKSVPSTLVSLRLAGALNTSVEALFELVETGVIECELAAASARGGSDRDRAGDDNPRVRLARVRSRWVAHRCSDSTTTQFEAADGVLESPVLESRPGAGPTRVRVWESGRDLAGNVLIAGCDPAIGLATSRLQLRAPGQRAHWLSASSARALDMVLDDQVHVAGLHLFDPERGDYNIGAIERRAHDEELRVFRLARWDVGLCVARGNSLSIEGAADLARAEVRVVHRDAGSGADELLIRLLGHRPAPESVRISARSHDAVTRIVAAGAADTGIVPRFAAISARLDFVPLVTECFDLVVKNDVLAEEHVRRLIDHIDSRGFRDELGAVSGYDASVTGHAVAELAL